MTGRYKKYAIGITVLILISASTFVNFSEENPESVLYRGLKNKEAVSSVIIPEKLTFADEKVPIDNFDTRESLEREMLVNTYWHSQTILLLKRSQRYFPVIDSILRRNNVPLDFKYLAMAESGLMQVVSPSNAVGFWQFLEGTAKDYNLEVNSIVDERYHIEKSTQAAAEYLKDSYDKFGSWTMAAASYNAGRRFVNEQMTQQKQDNYYDLLLGDEAGRYVFRIIALKLVMESPADYGFSVGADGYKPIPYYEVMVDTTINDFGQFALDNKTNYKLLKLLNPWLRKPYLNVYSGKSYFIKIPKQDFREVNIQEVGKLVEKQ